MINTDKLIICVAPCSSYPKDGTNPYIPVTPDEIAEEVYRAWNAGASLADIHAQTPEGNPTTDLPPKRIPLPMLELKII